ncbi:MAG TPA: rRNA adenine N-6-methyltransferase family protein, partial [Byssovorax sp.]
TGEAQSRAHVDQLRAALPAAWREVEIVAHAAPSPLAYRTRARIHARASGGRAIVGMNEAGSHEPVEVGRCAVLTPELESLRARVASILEGAHGHGDAQLALGAFAARDGSPRPGVIELTWSGPLAAACFGRMERGTTEGWLAGARVWSGESTKPASIGDPTPWMRGADHVPLRLAPGGFGQASDDGNALLARRVAALAKRALGTREDARVLELYAGAGNLTVLLAALCKTLVAVESSRESCDAARMNLAARSLASNVTRVVESDASTFAIPAATHLVVLDPPRSGARDACTRIAASSARHVLYVSCDAPTLGRDLAVLEAARFAPLAVEVFDLFPQTSHVESVVLLERQRG